MFTNSLRPSLAEVLAAPADAAIPICRVVPADIESPISVFLKLRRGGTGFLLESAEQDGSLGRYSFIGTSPAAVLRAGFGRGTVTTDHGIVACDDAPLAALRRFVGSAPVLPPAEGLPPFVGGAVGAFGYDLVRTLERLPAPHAASAALPAALFGRYETVVVFDHLKQRLGIVSLLMPGADRTAAYRRAAARLEQTLASLRRAPPAPPFDPAETADPDALLAAAAKSPDDEGYLRAVARAREYVHAGEAIQIVLARQLRLPFRGDPFRLYRALRILNPSPYMFYLDFPELAIVGASPEMLLRVADGLAQVCPIAGTRPRGSDAESDAAHEAELRADPKERAEHVMLVDLGRNDLGRVCQPGSVHVPRFMQVERYSHVMHLVSSVTGRLRDDVDALEAFGACFPAGTLTGAPKVRAMQLIDELEPEPRGVYGGAVAWVGCGARTLDSCIAIRSIVVRGAEALVQVGAGVVADSDPARELAETTAKARAQLAALALATPAPAAPVPLRAPDAAHSPTSPDAPAAPPRVEVPA